VEIAGLTSYPTFLLAVVIIAGLSAAVGVRLPRIGRISRRLVPACGGILVCIAAFWIAPELAETFGWSQTAFLLVSALALLFVVDRYAYPVCPACSHSHDHGACMTRLHGFAPPIVIAMVIHNVFDGWMLAHGGHALSFGMLVHKIPECIAFGVILSSSMKSRRTALLIATFVQFGALAGAALYPVTAPMGPHWIGALLALGGGTFLYLGIHALHGEWKRRIAESAVRAG
jgi:zinc transporter ZupT